MWLLYELPVFQAVNTLCPKIRTLTMNWSLCTLVWFGAFLAMAFSVTTKGFKGLQPILKKIIPEMEERWIVLLDLIVSPILGALFIYFIMQPSNMKDAVLEGLTWSGTFVALARNKDEE